MKDILRHADRTARDAEFVTFVEVAYQRHLRLALLLTGDRMRAEELLQDSLVKLYERWRRLSRPDDAHAYLRRVMTNNHISAWRRFRAERLVADVPEHGYHPAYPHPESEALRRALLALPPRQRTVVVLRHYEDMSEREIAQLIGCTVGTVKSQNARALDKLRLALAQPQPHGAR